MVFLSHWIISPGAALASLFVFQYHLTITWLLPILPITQCSHPQTQWINLWPFILTGLQVSGEAMSSGRGVGVVFPMVKFCRSSSRSCSSSSFWNLHFFWQCRDYRASKPLKTYDQEWALLSSTQHLSQTKSWRLMQVKGKWKGQSAQDEVTARVWMTGMEKMASVLSVLCSSLYHNFAVIFNLHPEVECVYLLSWIYAEFLIRIGKMNMLECNVPVSEPNLSGLWSLTLPWNPATAISIGLNQPAAQWKTQGSIITKARRQCQTLCLPVP